MSSVPRITDPAARTPGFAARIGRYVALAKPRIIELLLVTTVPSMVLAAGGWPGTWLVIGTLAGGALSAGGANAINNFVDRDVDAAMRRTARRPLPRDHVAASHALVFGVALGAAGFAWLWLVANLLAASIATAALLFYVFVYTLYLKRTSAQNIVIGGAAGAAPALVGWAAVTGSLALPAWVLFAVVFFWTPPHFWALALRYHDDYRRAGIPMLPVVAGRELTRRHIVLYSMLLFGVTLLLFPAVPMGWIYLVAALVLGLGFIGGAVRLVRRPDTAMQLFRFSNVYLSLLFAAVAADVLVG